MSIVGPLYGASTGIGVIGTGQATGVGQISSGNNWQWTTNPNYTYTNITSKNNNDKYAIFKLPTQIMPEAVYLQGRMLTIGILGTDVECAYNGDTLVFAPGVFAPQTAMGKIPVILQYADKMFHYNITNMFGIVEFEPESCILKYTFLSETKRGQNA